MFASLSPITQETLGNIHPRARRSVFWELDPETAAKVTDKGDPAFEKEAWLTTTLLNYGCCGFSIGGSTRVDGTHRRAVATVLYCGRDDAPGTVNMPTAPVSDDAEVLTSLFIDPGFTGLGLEAVLVDASIMELVQKDASAVEAFGRREDFPANAEDEEALGPEIRSILDRAEDIGLLSVATLESAGFQVVADHPVLPRLRLELPPQQHLLSAEAVELLLAETSAC
ncbi:hypothetical protein [Corynebacterium halotolerans]|uniref:Uncharacterized protein n=1 Tax=Corynebacterium halotolerans YIM 70093 = DSM 44683 TaxID=1121362 RepID=M1NWD6_9CORY|nr:hypothetical protein [Corynebacterium halotolerans]AGF73802.1 hypothetical protein A605_14030 [Corynebacterium halotolerans YIM 70093 = DSM 44683]